MISLPEGWFVVQDVVQLNMWDFVSWRYIRIQNGTTIGVSKAYIYCRPEHEFDYREASNKLREKINDLAG